MKMGNRCPRLVCLAGLLFAVNAAPAQTMIELPAFGGMGMAPDGKTLIATVPSAGQLVYIDTVGEKVAKKVELEFQPSAIARQGKTLFVATSGSPVIHVLDVESGKEMKKIKAGDEIVESVACHP